MEQDEMQEELIRVLKGVARDYELHLTIAKHGGECKFSLEKLDDLIMKWKEIFLKFSNDEHEYMKISQSDADEILHIISRC